MPILVDGHNLIPKIPGLNLSDLDDEVRLIEILQNYARLRRKGKIECYFDKAPSGETVNLHKFGLVVVKFARRGKSADDEIEARLKQLGREARNWTVVSSDRRVRDAARSYGAQNLTAEEFVIAIYAATRDEFSAVKQPKDNLILCDDEIVYWLSQFRKNADEKHGAKNKE
jgi:uncharacterized protein